MDLKEILISSGIESELAEKCSQAINGELHKEFIPKMQYNKKVVELESLKEKADDLGAVNGELEQLKTQLANKEEEFNNYKIDIEKKQTQDIKINKIKEQLKKDGITSDKLVNLLVKEVDISSLEFEDNNIKDWETIGKSLKENYSDFYTSTKTIGAEPSTPPTNNLVSFTKEDIQNMSVEEINKNWENISRTLK